MNIIAVFLKSETKEIGPRDKQAFFFYGERGKHFVAKKNRLVIHLESIPWETLQYFLLLIAQYAASKQVPNTPFQCPH